MRTLFLHPPSFDGFDGGAGARYQMKREVRSFWYPTWLAQPAALVEGSKLIDAPPHRLTFEDIAGEFKNRDLVVMHTSTPSFKADVRTAEMIKAINPGVKIGFIGAKVAVEPEKSLIAAKRGRFRRPQRIRLHHQGSRRRQALERNQGAFLPQQRGRRSFTTRTARFSRTWMRCRG